MESILKTVSDYLVKVLYASGAQLFVLLGPLIILSFCMHFIARLNEQLSYKVLGRTVYLYGFGWLGTSVHELGHALFAVIFGHKIDDMVLFSPNAPNGNLGYVNHSYNKKSLYQNLGNFFIGIGPVLLGSFMLFVITYLIYRYNISIISVPVDYHSFIDFEMFKSLVLNLWISVKTYYEVISGSQSRWWQMVLLFYCLYSIGSSITLSPADVKSSFRGFLIFVLLIVVFNLATIWIGNFAVTVLAYIGSLFSILYFLMIISCLVNLIFIVALTILYLIKKPFVR